MLNFPKLAYYLYRMIYEAFNFVEGLILQSNSHLLFRAWLWLIGVTLLTINELTLSPLMNLGSGQHWWLILLFTMFMTYFWFWTVVVLLLFAPLLIGFLFWGLFLYTGIDVNPTILVDRILKITDACVRALAPFLRHVVNANVQACLWYSGRVGRVKRYYAFRIYEDETYRVVEVGDTYSCPEDPKEILAHFTHIIRKRVLTPGTLFRLACVLLMLILWLIVQAIVWARQPIIGWARYMKNLILWTLLMIAIPCNFIDTIEYAWLLVRLNLNAFITNFDYETLVYKPVSEIILAIGRMVCEPARMTNSILHTIEDFKRQNPVLRAKLVHTLRTKVVKVVRAVEDLRLPEAIRTMYRPPTKERIQETLDLLNDLGLPVNVKLVNEHVAAKRKQWQGYEHLIITGSTYMIPLRNFATYVGYELENFNSYKEPGFVHTASYTTPEAEVRSTARYFTQPKIDVELVEPEDVYSILKKRYQNSRLATVHEVLKSWVRKYAVGFGFMGPKPNKGLTRRQLESELGGYGGLVQAWEKLIQYVGDLVPIAHVFTKFESLKVSKAAAGMVRTIIGVPLSHYAASSLFSFAQNRRHDFDTGPVKCGMPLTGYWFGKLWDQHRTRDTHHAGDLTAFDSSLARGFYKVVSGVRKLGFKQHADYHKICDLIDLVYDQLMTMPLAMKNDGTVVSKVEGGATGFGNTSSDNSDSLIVAYLTAWKYITGRSSSEFWLYCTLSGQCDDHILSVTANPYGFTFEKCIEFFPKMGLSLRKEVDSDELMDMEFLAKKPLKYAEEEKRKLFKYGIVHPEILTYHNKDRLLGKIKAATLSKDSQARAKRLLSYLYLTAHHKDVYLSLVHSINKLRMGSKFQEKIKIPSYELILRKWYSPGKLSDKLDDEVASELLSSDEQEIEGETVADVVQVSPGSLVLDILLALSAFPEILSPRFQSINLARHVQRQLGRHIAWPLSLISQRNGCVGKRRLLSWYTSTTVYRFLSCPDLMPYVDTGFQGNNLVSHWVFLALRFILPSSLFGENWYVLKLLSFIDRKVSTLNFAIDGKVCYEQKVIDLHLAELACVLVAGAIGNSFTHPSHFVPRRVNLPLLSDNISYWADVGWRKIQPSGRANYDTLLGILHEDVMQCKKLVVQAPTGVGKSTAMIRAIAKSTNRRVWVIEPRHVLVTGLVDYMNSIDECTGYGALTTGREMSTADVVVYATYQSFLLNQTLTTRDIIVVDEAHLDEPLYKFAVAELLSRDNTVLLTTATPDPTWGAISGLQEVEVEALNVFQVREVELEAENLREYVNLVADIIGTLPKGVKALVFMPTLHGCSELSDKLQQDTTILSSKTPNYNKDAQIFVSTKVSDAGLTIPDVEYVITSTMDVDVSIAIESNDLMNQQHLPYNYEISASTLKQRKGRTGRTCDGTFIKVKLTKTKVRNKHSTDADLVASLAEFLHDTYIRSKLPQTALALVETIEKFISSTGGDISVGNLLNRPTVWEQETPEHRAAVDLAMLYGLPGTTPGVSLAYNAHGLAPETPCEKLSVNVPTKLSDILLDVAHSVDAEDHNSSSESVYMPNESLDDHAAESVTSSEEFYDAEEQTAEEHLSEQLPEEIAEWYNKYGPVDGKRSWSLEGPVTAEEDKFLNYKYRNIMETLKEGEDLNDKFSEFYKTYFTFERPSGVGWRQAP